MKKESGIYGFILLAVLLGWLLLEWMKKKLQPLRSARQALLFLAGVLLFLFVYTAAIIFAVRMIFGKPS